MKEEKGIYELKRRIRKTEMAQEEREQERETLDNNTLCYCIPNFFLQKLVHQVPRSVAGYLLVNFNPMLNNGYK